MINAEEWEKVIRCLVEVKHLHHPQITPETSLARVELCTSSIRISMTCPAASLGCPVLLINVTLAFRLFIHGHKDQPFSATNITELQS